MSGRHIPAAEWTPEQRARELASRRRYKERHSVEIKQRKKRWVKQNRARVNAAHRAAGYSKRYDEAHRTERAAAARNRRANMTETKRAEIREQNRLYQHHRYRTDTQFKLRSRLRNFINGSIKRHRRGGSVVSSLGCSLEEFINHIENQFHNGMTWENWSRNGWHLDHIVPLAKFDLSDPDQFVAAMHYTNYQPLWALENFRKGARR